jgi:hypothetical protein
MMYRAAASPAEDPACPTAACPAAAVAAAGTAEAGTAGAGVVAGSCATPATPVTHATPAEHKTAANHIRAAVITIPVAPLSNIRIQEKFLNRRPREKSAVETA